MTTLDSRVSLVHTVLNNVVRSVHSELNRKDSDTSVCHLHDLGSATVHPANKQLPSNIHVGARSTHQSHSRTMFDVPEIAFGAKIKHNHTSKDEDRTHQCGEEMLSF